MNDLLIHLGLHRTGSTWIQRSMLPDANIPIDDIWPDRADLARRVIVCSDADFASAEIREKIDRSVAEATQAGRCPAISNERLSGNPNSGAFDMDQTSHRLHQLRPDAKIMIVIRDQQSALESIWCQAVRMGLYSSAYTYLKTHDLSDFRVPHFVPEYLYFDRIVSQYMKLFGRDRVLVLDFERLRQDPKSYVNSICDFMGVARVDSAPSEVQYARPHPLEAGVLRRGNLLFRRTSMNIGPPFESEHMFNLWRRFSGHVAKYAPNSLKKASARRLTATSTAFIDQIDTQVRASNKRLVDELGVELVSSNWRL